MHKKVLLCDFDGTLIHGDSLFMFLKFAKGNFTFYFGLLFLSPILFLGFINLISKHRLKEIVLSFFLRGYSVDMINQISSNFIEILNYKVNKKLLHKIHQYVELGFDVYIVSASIENWIKPWALSNGINNVIATKLEFKNNKFTGRFSTINCNKEEKVNRIKEILVNREDYFIISFGDSKGDYPMFNYSDEFYIV